MGMLHLSNNAKQKPIGPLEVDRSVPLANDLVFATVCSELPLVNIVTNTPPSSQGDNLYYAGTDSSRGVAADGSGSEIEVSFSSFDLDLQTEGVTIVIRYKSNNAPSGFERPINIYASSDSTKRLSLGPRISNFRRLNANAGFNTTAEASVSPDNTDAFSVLAATHKSGSQEVFVDGESIATSSNSTNWDSYTWDTISLFANAGLTGYYDGIIDYALVFKGVKTSEEIRWIGENVYSLFKPSQDITYFTSSGEAGGISGTSDIDLDDVSVTSSASVNVSGASDSALEYVTTVSQGTVSVSASSDVTLDDVSVSALGVTGDAPVSGTSDITLDDITVVGTAVSSISGTSDITLEGTSSTGLGTSSVSGSSDVTLSDLGITSSVSVTVLGEISVSLDDLSLSGVGSIATAPDIEGNSNYTINTNGGGVRMYFNGTDYFLI